MRRTRRCLCLAALLAAACGEAKPGEPLVVIVLIDTLRADSVGLYGSARPATPRIDALGAESVVFEQAYAPAPWTLPSVVSLLTSRFACEHRVTLDGDRIDTALAPLAQQLERAGYATASFHANPYAGTMSGLDRGFETSASAPLSVDTIGGWLDRIGTRPAFVYVHDIEPHDPYIAPAELVALFGEVTEVERARVNAALQAYRGLTRVDFAAGRPPGTTDNTEAQRAALRDLVGQRPAVEALYAASVRRADDLVGSVVDALKARSLWDRTFFILVSDHGEEFGEHGGWAHDQSLYEEVVRVPLVIRFPGARFGGSRPRGVVSLVDVLPTVLDVLGLPPFAGVQGRSLLPLALGPGEPEEAIAILSLRINRKKYYRPFKETRGDVNVLVREGRWKGIWNAEHDTLELYDLAADPGERRDLAARHPERAARLGEAARRWLAACETRAGRRATGPVDPDSRERLRALGYVE